MTKRTTKHSLIMSALALLLCCSMLIGTTFAWFTDSVESKGNKIQSGTLKVDLELLDKTTGTWSSIKTDSKALFNYDKWEPGYTEVKVLKIENEGTLALKWQTQFIANYELTKLAEVIDVYVLPYGVLDDVAAATVSYPTRALENYTKVGTLKDFIGTIKTTTVGELLANQSAYLGIALKMQEEANNDYQNLNLVSGNSNEVFDIKVYATQLTSEIDSFDKDYDEDSEFDIFPLIESTPVQPGVSAYPIKPVAENGTSVASFDIPAAALADDATEIVVKVDETELDPNFTVAAGYTADAYEITVEGLKEGNTEPIKVQIFVGEGLDDSTISLYHYTTPVAFTYNPSTGWLSFFVTSFSPFTVIYDAGSEYVAPELPNTPPTATVVANPEYVGVDLPWGEYGDWSPTEGLDSTLKAAYTFTCDETPEEAAENGYANWYCDFFVKLDRDLEPNQIFLGGNYPPFDWVGFHNKDLTLEANTEIPLLDSVGDPWTYSAIAANVGSFICGVGDVDNALTGAKFTVTLRLTNPEDAEDTIDIEKIEYVFEATPEE